VLQVVVSWVVMPHSDVTEYTHHNPKNHDLNLHYHENLKSCKISATENGQIQQT